MADEDKLLCPEEACDRLAHRGFGLTEEDIAQANDPNGPNMQAIMRARGEMPQPQESTEKDEGGE